MAACLWFDTGDKYKLIPQWVSLLIVLNKENILGRLDNEFKIINLNNPILNANSTQVVINCRFVPKVSRVTTLESFRISCKGYIESINTPANEFTSNPNDLSLKLDEPKELIFRIKSYEGYRLPRFLILEFNSNSRKKMKTFILHKCSQ